jgi:hypothetical protein
VSSGKTLATEFYTICYAWIGGVSNLVLVVFAGKRHEIQYLKDSIPQKQRVELGQLIEPLVTQVKSGQFPSHNGIRFPQNDCVSRRHLGLFRND